MTERDKFEAWFKEEYGALPANSATERATFRAWQARAILAAGASEGQAEPVAWITEAKYPAPRFVFGSVDPSEVWKQPYTPLYDHRPFIDEFCKAYAEEWQDTLKEQSDCIKARDAEIAALRERIAGMEKDAERYRWLREGGPKQDDLIACVWGETLDRMIDAATAKEKQP